MWKYVGYFIVAVFGIAAVEYVCGRILLPSLQLGVPGYWPWFWVTFIWSLVYAAIGIIKELQS